MNRRSSSFRSTNVALVVFTAAVSLATVATAAVALAGCSSSSSKGDEDLDSGTLVQFFTDAGVDGASVVDDAGILTPTGSVTLQSFAANNNFPGLCASGVQSYTYVPSNGSLDYNLCPASGPFGGNGLTGTIVLTSADNAALLAKLQAIVTWPTATASCSSGVTVPTTTTTTYSASVTSADGTTSTYFIDSDTACTPGGDSEIGVRSGGIEAAYDDAASIVAAKLAAIEKGGALLVSPTTAAIYLMLTAPPDDGGDGVGCTLGDKTVDYTFGTSEFVYSFCTSSTDGAESDMSYTTVQLSTANIASLMTAIDAIATAPLGKYCAVNGATPTGYLTDETGTMTTFAQCNGAADGVTSVLHADAALQAFVALATAPSPPAPASGDGGVDASAGN